MGCGVGFAGRTRAHRRADRRYASAADRGENRGGGLDHPPRAHLGRNENLEVIKVPQEREDVPQSPEDTVNLLKLVLQERVTTADRRVAETVAVVGLAPRERVQHRTAEQIEDLPQHPEETVEVVTLVPQEQAQQQTCLCIRFASWAGSVRCEVSRSCVRDMILRHGCGKDLPMKPGAPDEEGLLTPNECGAH